MPDATTQTIRLIDCPACGERIIANLTYDVKLTPSAYAEGAPIGPIDKTATATLTLTSCPWRHRRHPQPRDPRGLTMNDLRALLGDRYVSTMRAAALADNPEAITNAQRVGGKLGQLMYLSAVNRLDRTLAAVLPDLLAEANTRADEAEAKARRFANLLGNNAKTLNDTLSREVLRQKAAAFDECTHAWEAYLSGTSDNVPPLNPYRQDSEGTEAE